MRFSIRFLILGAAAGLVTPSGLLLYGLATDRSFDAVELFFAMAVGGVLALGTAGWMIGRKEDGLLARNRRLEELSARLQALSTTDPLTGVPNRRALDDRLSTELARAHRYKAPLSVVMIDLDHFKGLNDQYGHLFGDAVLKEIGRLLESERRAGDMVARYGGEEFAAVLPHTDARAATAWAERVRGELADRVLPAERGSIRMTASFGVASVVDENETKDSLLAAADAALYAAKGEGRDRVHLAARASSRTALAPSGLGFAGA